MKLPMHMTKEEEQALEMEPRFTEGRWIITDPSFFQPTNRAQVIQDQRNATRELIKEFMA